MRVTSSALSRTIAGVRMATSVFFYCLVSTKVAGTGFSHGRLSDVPAGLHCEQRGQLLSPFLAGVVLPHAVFFGYVVGVVELLIGISLLIGLWVRPACVLGILFLINMLLATWWEPGHGVPVWRYFGNELDHLPLLLLLIIFFAADAGRVWSLDGRRGQASRG
jgi:uncharacterized membrane protein YphA (DoxX/SURF4 family)